MEGYETGYTKIVLDGVDWLNFGQNGDLWLALLNVLMNFLVSKMGWISWVSEELESSQGKYSVQRLGYGLDDPEFESRW